MRSSQGKLWLMFAETDLPPSRARDRVALALKLITGIEHDAFEESNSMATLHIIATTALVGIEAELKERDSIVENEAVQGRPS